MRGRGTAELLMVGTSVPCAVGSVTSGMEMELEKRGEALVRDRRVVATYAMVSIVVVAGVPGCSGLAWSWVWVRAVDVWW